MNFPGRISDDNGPEWNDAPHDLTDEKHVETLQAENKRLREALERCREWFRTWNHAPGDPEMLSPEALEKLCEEASK